MWDWLRKTQQVFVSRRKPRDTRRKPQKDPQNLQNSQNKNEAGDIIRKKKNARTDLKHARLQMSCMQVMRFSVRVKNEQKEQASHVTQISTRNTASTSHGSLSSTNTFTSQKTDGNQILNTEEDQKCTSAKYIQAARKTTCQYISRSQDCKTRNTKKKRKNTKVRYACARSRLPLQHRDIKTSN
ncbi:unnamed protein product [Ectocarpus sp. 12 AP-2014]